MFGFVYALANLVGITVSGTKKAIDNAYYKEQGQERYNNGTDYGAHIYYDAEGRARDLTTNHIMFTYRENGDLYIEDTKTKRIRNLSEEEMDRKIAQVKATNGEVKAVLYKYWSCENSGLKDNVGVGIPGTVYKDVNNGQLYFERYITWRKNDFSKAGVMGDYCCAYFYLRISDGLIVSISDKQKERDKEKNRNIDYTDFIDFFNSEQKKGGFVVRNRNPYAKGRDNYFLGNEKICNE